MSDYSLAIFTLAQELDMDKSALRKSRSSRWACQGRLGSD